MTQQTMTKEQILGNYYREHKDTETAIYEAMEHYKDQELSAEREKTKNAFRWLNEILDGIIESYPSAKETALNIKKSINEYDTATKES